MKGSPIRQEYLEKALKWISNRDGIKIEQYIADHQNDPNANELWIYFKNVIDWVKLTFPVYRKEMKGVDWGPLYDENKDKLLDAKHLEEEIQRLILDDDVTKVSGIYPYLLTGKEKYLSIRSFTDSQKRKAYTKAGGICAKCGKHFEIDEIETDHIKPWSEGGKTTLENCQILCKNCNRTKSNI